VWRDEAQYHSIDGMHFPNSRPMYHVSEYGVKHSKQSRWHHHTHCLDVIFTLVVHDFGSMNMPSSWSGEDG
jgi:hypothetical protein